MRLVSYTVPLEREAGTGKATTQKGLPYGRFRRPNEACGSMFSSLRLCEADKQSTQPSQKNNAESPPKPLAHSRPVASRLYSMCRSKSSLSICLLVWERRMVRELSKQEES